MGLTHIFSRKPHEGGVKKALLLKKHKFNFLVGVLHYKLFKPIASAYTETVKCKLNQPRPNWLGKERARKKVNL